MQTIADPRSFSAETDAAVEPALRLARAVLDADTSDVSSAAESALVDWLKSAIVHGDSRAIVAALEAAPSVDAYRALWRALHGVLSRPGSGDLRVVLFAIPVVLVVGADAPAAIEGVVPEPDRLTAILLERGMVGGSRNLSLGNALVGPGQLSIGRMLDLAFCPTLDSLAHRLARDPLVPQSISVPARQEQAHLRFLVGSALCGPGSDAFVSDAAAGGAMALTRELVRQLESAVATALPLAGVPQPPLVASHRGFVAHRDVGFQLFLGSAVREFRGRYGEPSAWISAHRLEGGGGELRVTLSSPIAEAVDAGFRYPLHPLERAGDALEGARTLLADCRIADIRAVPGIYPDLDPETGRVLLLGADRAERARSLALQ